MGTRVDLDKLATMVRTKRASRGLRETAREIGYVSSATLSRIENGKMPDMETFVLLCDWLGVSPAEFFLNVENSEREAVDPSEAIAIQLRADKHLDPATANALAALVKAAYRDLAQSESSQRKTPEDEVHDDSTGGA